MTSSRTPVRRTLLFAALLTAPAGLAAQTTLPMNAVPAAQPGQAPSAVLMPAITQVRQALVMLRPDKWKAPSSIIQASTQNIGSIQRDLDSTLPGLLAIADRNPASVQDVLPTYRNVDALYDVLLRVTEVSKLAAPAPQSDALEQAMASLDDARRAFGDNLQAVAVNQTKAIVLLQGQLHAAQTVPAPTTAAAAKPPVCPAPPAKRRTTTATTKPKSSTGTSTSTNTQTTPAASTGH